MKTFTRMIAVVMLVVMIAALMAACGEEKKKAEPTEDPGIINDLLIGTWKGTDSDDNVCTWVFNNDKTCSLTVGTEKTNGVYMIHSENNGQIDITLDGQEKQYMTYVCTKTNLLINGFVTNYSCERQK